MSGRTPGWADEPERPVPSPPHMDGPGTGMGAGGAAVPPARPAVLPPSPPPDATSNPALLDVEVGGLIDHQAPAALPPVRVAVLAGAGAGGWLSSLGTLGAAVMLLLLACLVLGLGVLLRDAFLFSPVLGWVGAALGAAGGVLLLRTAWREWRTLRRLEALEALALVLQATPDGAPPPAGLRAWAQGLGARLPEALPALQAVAETPTMAEARGLLRDAIYPALDARVAEAGGRAARQVFVTTAILPTPALEAAAMGLLGLRLIREVAVLHGLRPGIAVLLRLLRRLIFSTGMAIGTEMLVETGVEHVVEGHAARLAGGAAGGLAGAAVAARRLGRLARLTARCCRPL